MTTKDHIVKIPVHSGGIIPPAEKSSLGSCHGSKACALTLAVLLGIAGGLGAPGMVAADSTEVEITDADNVSNNFNGKLSKDGNVYHLGMTWEF